MLDKVIKCLVNGIMFLDLQEMDLIYDLRGQMEQLHHEMAELQKSIRGCMNMQVKLQQLMKLKVSAASHSGEFRKLDVLVSYLSLGFPRNCIKLHFIFSI